MSTAAAASGALFDLTGRAVFITGGSSGIGLAIAMAMARAGASVGLLGRDADRLATARAAVERLLHPGTQALTYAADVREYDAVAAAVGAFADAVGSGTLRCVVAAAAGNFIAPAASMSAKAFRTVVEIDLLGTFHAFRAAYPHLPAGVGASLIALSAPQSTVPLPGQAHAAAAKAGVDALVRNLALEWGCTGVRVNAIVPGPIEGTEGLERLAITPAVREAVRRSTPLGRFGRAEEVASLAVFLASDAAAYITGTAIACDGGSALTMGGTLSPAALARLLREAAS